ncbi:MAG: heparinase II/III family protein [Chthoniobacteraceae bacterium]
MNATLIPLLNTRLDATQIQAILARHPRVPLLPPLGSPEWCRAAGNPFVAQLMKPLRAMAEAECSQPMPVLTDELYASFALTGQRLPFEAVYFERRRHLARAAMSLLLCREDDPWRGRFLASMVEKFTSVFEEVSWALPAHVNWHNDDRSGKEPMRIDLFGAETANLMGEMLNLFGAVLPAALQERVRERLTRNIFENYLATPFHWKTITNNWNAVCHQGVLGAALAVCDDDALLARMLAEMQRHLPGFLEGFGPDGGCSEGPGYWNYGFGWFAVLNEQLETRAGLSLFEGDEKVREMARYGQRVALSKGNLPNFADASSHDLLRPPLMGYLARRFEDADCTAAAKECYRLRLGEEFGQGERDDLFQLARQVLYFPEDLSPSSAPVADHFFPDLAVLIARGTDDQGHPWEFAAKAGHNEEHHNHNDCGSFILNIDGQSLISEIGSPEYDRDYFSEKRYESIAARTRGHSLPIINGCEQRPGADTASTVLSHESGGPLVRFAVDATRCYPAEAGCRRFIRRFEFDKKAGCLRIADIFELSRQETLETALISFHPFSLSDGVATVEAGGLKLAIRPAPGTRLARTETLQFRNHGGKANQAFRLALEPVTLSETVEMAIEIELL